MTTSGRSALPRVIGLVVLVAAGVTVTLFALFAVWLNSFDPDPPGPFLLIDNYTSLDLEIWTVPGPSASGAVGVMVGEVPANAMVLPGPTACSGIELEARDTTGAVIATRPAEPSDCDADEAWAIGREKMDWRCHPLAQSAARETGCRR